MNILKIDTTQQGEITVILDVNGKERVAKEKFQKGSEVLLPAIKRLLTENNIKLEKLDKIYVKSGPGSYTGIRVGLSVANTLSHFLKIPINNLSSGKIVQPIYK